jgi:L-threonylcarbamoyladenylate synthase
VNPWHARLAVRVLRRGGLVLHATEGVWGFACDPFDAGAVARLLSAKGRAAAKGLILIGDGPDRFAPELDALDAAGRSAVIASWPGAVTWILPNREFPPWITGGRDTVAVRVPGHADARALVTAFDGPLVSTSANPTGRPPARNRFQARARLRDLRRRGRRWRRPDEIYLLPGETGGRRGPSEIRTVAGERLRGAG